MALLPVLARLNSLTVLCNRTGQLRTQALPWMQDLR